MSAPEPLSAHALLIEQHAFLRRLARSLVADPERADDLAQDVAVLALRHPPRAGSSPRAWLARVLRNRAVSLARSETRRRDREANVPEPAAQPTPPEFEARLRVQRAVIEAVARLEEPYRSVVLLRYDQDLAPTAISARLGVPVATVKTRLARALERLRRDLDARDEPGTPAWSVVLLAGLDHLRPSAATAAAAAGGAIVGAKLVGTVAALCMLGVWGTWWAISKRGAIPDSHPIPAARERALAASSEAQGAAALGAAASEPIRTALAALGEPDAPPDWALAVKVHGFRADQVGLAHVAVFGKSIQVPELELELEPRPLWTIDLEPLLEEGESPPDSVRITVDHPDFLPAEISVLVPGAWKDAPSTGGRLEAELTLSDPKAIVTGEVQLEDEPQSVVLGAAIYAMSQGSPVMEPVDRVTLDANRRFRLRTDHAAEHVVVAYVEGSQGKRTTDPALGGTLRPTSRILSLPTIGQEEIEVDPLVLEVGETISGRLEGDAGTRMLVRCGSTRTGGRFQRSMFWTEGRFENGPTVVHLAEDSTFEVHGLAPSEYVLGLSTLSGISTSDREPLVRFLDGRIDEVRVVAPARDVTLSFSLLDVVFEVFGDGAPLPGAELRLVLDEDPENDRPSPMTSQASANGRIRIQCNPKRSLSARISAIGYEPKDYRFDVSELRSGDEVRLEFDGRATPRPMLHVAYVGDLDRLGSPEGIGFRAFECASRSESEIAEALATPFLETRGPPWGQAGAILLEHAKWDARQGTWSSNELPAGKYVVAASRTTHDEGEPSYVLGGAFLVDMHPGADVHAALVGVEGGGVRFSVVRSRNEGPELRDVAIHNALGQEVLLLIREVGAQAPFIQIDHLGNHEVVGALPSGDYALTLRLRGGVERSVPFRVDIGATTDVRVDLSQL